MSKSKSNFECSNPISLYFFSLSKTPINLPLIASISIKVFNFSPEKLILKRGINPDRDGRRRVAKSRGQKKIYLLLERYEPGVLLFDT